MPLISPMVLASLFPLMASNDRTINGELILRYYKGQNAVEKGFRFLKDKSLRVAEEHLKKEERIEALSMIIIYSLLIVVRSFLICLTMGVLAF